VEITNIAKSESVCSDVSCTQNIFNEVASEADIGRFSAVSEGLLKYKNSYQVDHDHFEQATTTLHTFLLFSL